MVARRTPPRRRAATKYLSSQSTMPGRSPPARPTGHRRPHAHRVAPAADCSRSRGCPRVRGTRGSTRRYAAARPPHASLCEQGRPTPSGRIARPRPCASARRGRSWQAWHCRIGSRAGREAWPRAAADCARACTPPVRARFPTRRRTRAARRVATCDAAPCAPEVSARLDESRRASARRRRRGPTRARP
eukprot:scaffold16814_cov69-Phaeocystis_antarctica.AAC.14